MKSDAPDQLWRTDEQVAAGLSALSHPARLRILRELSQRPSCCCKDVVQRLDLAQSTVSQHLKILVDAGLVVFSPDQQRSRYTLHAEALQSLAGRLGGLSNLCTASLNKTCG